MGNYLITFREMLSLRGLSDHTLKGYCPTKSWHVSIKTGRARLCSATERIFCFLFHNSARA